MEKFKSVLKKRISIMLVFNVVAIIFIALTGLFSHMSVGGDEDINDMIHGFQVGIFIGLQMVILIYVTKYRNALKNEDELKKLYIEENDERVKLIKDKIGGVGLNFTLGIIATATVTSGFFNQIVFITLLGVLFFSVIVKGSLKIYYRRKF